MKSQFTNGIWDIYNNIYHTMPPLDQKSVHGFTFKLQLAPKDV